MPLRSPEGFAQRPCTLGLEGGPERGVRCPGGHLRALRQRDPGCADRGQTSRLSWWGIPSVTTFTHTSCRIVSWICILLFSVSKAGLDLSSRWLTGEAGTTRGRRGSGVLLRGQEAPTSWQAAGEQPPRTSREGSVAMFGGRAKLSHAPL